MCRPTHEPSGELTMYNKALKESSQEGKDFTSVGLNKGEARLLLLLRTLLLQLLSALEPRGGEVGTLTPGVELTDSSPASSQGMLAVLVPGPCLKLYTARYRHLYPGPCMWTSRRFLHPSLSVHAGYPSDNRCRDNWTLPSVVIFGNLDCKGTLLMMLGGMCAYMCVCGVEIGDKCICV